MPDLSQKLTIIHNTTHYLAAANVKERMSSSKQVTESLDKEILNLKKLNNVKVTEDHEPDTFNRVAAMENFS